MCTKGRRQSPIDIEPDKLLFDPYLRPLHIDKHKVNAINLFEYRYLIRPTMRIDCIENITTTKNQNNDTKHSQTDFMTT